MAETFVYLEIEPLWSEWRKDAAGDPQVAGIRVRRVLKNRPYEVVGVLVKLQLLVPDAAFKPLRPNVTVEIPESALLFDPAVTVDVPGNEP